MKWNETIASECRYGSVISNVFGNATILWEDSEADWQGHASILAKMEEGHKYKFGFYEWWYGSCSGCDTWEAAEAPDEDIIKEVNDTTLWFDDEEQVTKFMTSVMEKNFKDYKASRTTDMELGQMVDLLSGSTPDRLTMMAKFWLEPKEEG